MLKDRFRPWLYKALLAVWALTFYTVRELLAALLLAAVILIPFSLIAATAWWAWKSSGAKNVSKTTRIAVPPAITAAKHRKK
jgi:hypothetical protein